MKKHLALIDADKASDFIAAVEDFENTHKVLVRKFQRNLYYSLSGSTGTNKVAQPRSCIEDKTSLCQNYLAFLLWEEEEEKNVSSRG